MDLAQLLELLYASRERWQTVRLVADRRSIDRFGRELDAAPDRSVGMVRVDATKHMETRGTNDGAPRAIHAITELWARTPHLLRWETVLVDEGSERAKHIGGKDGHVFWMRDADGVYRSHSSERGDSTIAIPEEDLIDPAPFLGWLRLEIGEPVRWAGREGIRVFGNATRTRGGTRISSVDLIVDRATGVILSITMSDDAGDLLMDMKITEIAFDEPHSLELFRP